uniref:ubiquitinyl hydrolase 1 n=1 Tax=Davidia involucrata TaxID=16924 RepID=A0A5B7AG99_DAVIN
MLLGGDLGFSCLVLVVVFFGPVIGFVVRRKWRLAVARREEIKRLLVLASEEAARAELEASAGYITSGSTTCQLQYQCAVCFCPTTTRCARCKAVRYCSGKCQIIHWRQGHKEECYPFTTTDQINDVGGSSIQKAFQHEENEIYGNSFEPEGRQFAKPVEAVPEEPAFSNSSHSPEVLCEKDDIKIECLADGKGTNSTSEFTSPSLSDGYSSCTTSSESSVDVAVNRVSSSHHPERSDGHQSTNIIPDKVETTYANSMDQTRASSEYPTSVNSVDNFTSSAKLNQIKLDCSDGDTHSGSTSSSGWTVDGSNESSISEPSTPSSGFWEGTIDTKRCRDDVLDDSSQSSSSEAGDGNLSDFQSSLRFPFNLPGDTVPPLHVLGSDAKTIISDNACPATLGIKMPIDGAALSEETSKDATKVRSLPSLNSEMSRIDDEPSSESCILQSRELFSSSASHVNPASGTGGHSISTDSSNVSSLTSLSTERSNCLVNGMSNTSHVLKSKEVGTSSSRASDAYLSSSAGMHSVSSAKSGKVDGAHAVAAGSSQFASYSPNASNGLKTSMRKVVDQLKSSKSSQHYPLGVGSEIAGRYNKKGLFPYELFVKLYNWNKVELRPCGLINCGNSCYANAVLQCLAFTPPLNTYLLQGLHSKSCEKKGWCFTCEFERLILKAKEGNSPLSPIGILSRMQNIGSHLGNGREEDAHEFLRYAIDTMQSICLKEAGVKASGTLEEETTLIGLTFGGYLRSKIKCMKCGGKSERHEKMMDLTVEIGGDIGTLEEALRQFTGTEILDGENKYQCSRCKSYEKAKKKLTILEAPNVLTIALKRFQSGKFGKLNKAIRFPEILNLAPYMSGTSDKSPIYGLYGVVVHLDIMNAAFSGHYVCYVKNIENKWFKIDDSTVKAVELERVLNKGAYMLLYARCSPRAPRLIRNSIIPRDPRKPKNPTFKSRSHQPDPRDGYVPDPLNAEPFYMNHTSFQRIQTIFEEDSSSDNSSSVCFSEEGSSSTDSTRGSTSTDEFMDNLFGDLGYNWNSPWRNSSDSDTSSSSSSSPSPLYSRHSPLADLDRYSSECPEPGGSHSDNVESAAEGHGLRARPPNWSSKLEGDGSEPFLYSDTTKQCRKLVSSSSSSSSNSSCRETDSERLGSLNPLGNVKSGVSFRRSTRERRE